MSVADLRSDEVRAQAARALSSVRADSGVSLSVARTGSTTRIDGLAERGGYRAKFPAGDIGLEAVFINTGGGMLGGDKYRFEVHVGPGAAVTVASQSAERIYRTLGPPTDAHVRLDVEAGGCLAWLPQETILFDGARLSRRIEVDLAADATLILAEAVVFGRAARGETIRTGALNDRWFVRRAGRLAFVEALSIEGDIHAQLQRPAVAGGARLCATVLYMSADAEDHRERVREALGEPAARAAISAWNGRLIARLLATDASTLRRDLIQVVTTLAHRPMPRVWNC